MKFHLLTIFPDFFNGPLDHGVVPRAAKKGLLELAVHDLRRWTFDRHKSVDDRPFGGEEGMLMKAEPIFLAVEEILGRAEAREKKEGQKVVLLSAQGKLFDQDIAKRFAAEKELLLICGRYEGVDERVAEHVADEEICIGDFVLSGGELAAAIVVDTVARLLPGVLGNEASSRQESFSTDSGQLDCPHYTRPADFRGLAVPEVLLGGNHEEIRRWRLCAAIAKTVRNRPDLLK